MSQPPHKRILFIRPSALGDVCRSVPVVASLKKQWSDASIDWLVQTEFVESISSHPAIENVIPFPRQTLKKWYLPNGFLKTVSFLRGLKSNKYDLVIDGQGLGRSGLFSWATRSATRIGSASAREFGWLAYTAKVRTQCEHTVDQMLELCKHAGATICPDMQLYCNPNDVAWWNEFRDSNEISEYVVIAPTSRWKSKQWPIERFLLVAKHLLQLGLQVVVVGAPHESSQTTELCELEGVFNLLPVMTIGRMMAVISSSTFVIANDSAALHIAVGFNRTLLGLYGPTDPRRVGPYKLPDGVLAATVDYNKVHYRDRSLGNRIMQQIETDEVIERIDQLLKAVHE